MKNLFRLLGAGAVVVAGLAVTTGTAGAEATVTDSTTTCGTFAAQGTTDAEFYVVEVWDPATEEDLFIEAFPADEGTFDFEVSFPAAETGTALNYLVWGSPTDDTSDWDGQAYFEVDVEACTAVAPTSTTTSTVTPTTPTSTPTSVAPAAQAAEVTPAFTG